MDPWIRPWQLAAQVGGGLTWAWWIELGGWFFFLSRNYFLILIKNYVRNMNIMLGRRQWNFGEANVNLFKIGVCQ